jgi:hypothetical protein
MEVSGEVRSTSWVTLGFGQGWPSSRPPHPRLWMKERICSPALLCVSRKKGQWGMRSCDELKTVITHHFGFSKHELLAYRSVPDPFVIIFFDRRDRDLVFAAGRLIDGPLELSFRAWDLDDFGERVVLPYHIRSASRAYPTMPGVKS